MADGKKPQITLRTIHSHSQTSAGDHSHDHCGHHGHSHGHSHGAIGNIRIAFFLNLSFSLIELIGGFWIGSVAIMADAVHDFGDSISLGTAWGLERYANRRRDRSFNFGYRRFSLLSALVSGITISVGSVVIIIEAIRRFTEPREPLGGPMIGLAVLGLAVNGFAAWKMSAGKTQNEKMLTWHLLEDVMGWGLILIGAIAIVLTGAVWLDPAMAIALALFVLFNVAKHIKGTIYLFLQGRPENFSDDAFLKESLAVPGVERIDHLAVWSLDGQTSILSARLHLHSVRDPLEIERVKAGVREIAARHGAKATLETCLAEHAPHGDETDGD